MSSTLTIVLGVIVIALIAAGLAFASRKQRAARLRSKFGDEYHHAVETAGSKAKAQAHLIEREHRVKKFTIRPLSAEERERFEPAWRDVQAHFVENPEAAIASADDLLGEIMRTRGYPVGDFEQRAADLSVDHPRVVQHYRAAHDIAVKHESAKSGEGDVEAEELNDTEELRQAMLNYRELYDELAKMPANDTEISEMRVDKAS